MERTCKTCRRTYRGLVCHACHPRTKKQKEPTSSPEEIRARFRAEAESGADVVIGGPMTGERHDCGGKDDSRSV